jgi:hypothetical protein
MVVEHFRSGSRWEIFCSDDVWWFHTPFYGRHYKVSRQSKSVSKQVKYV